MTKILPAELIGAEVVETGYYDETVEEYDWIYLKLKNGKVARIGSTNWETLWVSYEKVE